MSHVFFDDTAKTYDAVARWATFGKDRYWKEEIIKKIQNADSILELACGTGILSKRLAQSFSQSKIVCVDISETYLSIAKKKLKTFQNISFVHKDAEKLKLEQKFDCICSSYIPKYCNAQTLIQTCISHLNPEGSIILHDFIYPQNKALKNLWQLYFVVLLFAGNFIPSWKFAFSELPNLIKKSNWIADYKQALEQNGFGVRQQNLTWSTSSILHAK